VCELLGLVKGVAGRVHIGVAANGLVDMAGVSTAGRVRGRRRRKKKGVCAGSFPTEHARARDPV
jgi:hypothetical protein